MRESLKIFLASAFYAFIDNQKILRLAYEDLTAYRLGNAGIVNTFNVYYPVYIEIVG